MKNVLLAGANGFIGSFLYNTIKDKYSISAIVNNSKEVKENFYSIDLTNKKNVKVFAEKCNYFHALVFLVGLAHKKGKRKEINDFRLINKITLVNLLSQLEKQNKLPNKIIFASTISVYGEKLNQIKYEEESTKAPISPYAVTKLEAEEYLLKNYSERSWILRFAPVYSSNFRLNIQRRTQLLRGFYRIGNGSKKLSLCNIKNIGIVVKSILDNKIPAETYNISDKSEYTYNDLLNHLDAKWVIPIPILLIKVFYYAGKIFNNTFLKENSIKLISDNTFPSDRIRQYIKMPALLKDLK